MPSNRLGRGMNVTMASRMVYLQAKIKDSNRGPDTGGGGA